MRQNVVCSVVGSIFAESINVQTKFWLLLAQSTKPEGFCSPGAMVGNSKELTVMTGHDQCPWGMVTYVFVPCHTDGKPKSGRIRETRWTGLTRCVWRATMTHQGTTQQVVPPCDSMCHNRCPLHRGTTQVTSEKGIFNPGNENHLVWLILP